MKLIKLTNINRYFTIDDEDELQVKRYSWYLDNSGIRGRVKDITINIGRFILGPSELPIVDHIDLNVYNNQRSNLRNATKSQNNVNRCIQENNTSGYKGVYWKAKQNKWCAQINYNRRKIYLGLFTNIKDAANAYDKAALQYFGAFARINEHK